MMGPAGRDFHPEMRRPAKPQEEPGINGV